MPHSTIMANEKAHSEPGRFHVEHVVVISVVTGLDSWLSSDFCEGFPAGAKVLCFRKSAMLLTLY